MEKFRTYFILILIVLFTTYSLQAQSDEDRKTIEHLYDLLQTRGTTSNDIAALTPNIMWKEARPPKAVKDRYKISFYGIMKNEWVSLLFKELNFTEPRKNEILVTGIVSGRQPTECDLVTSNFQHSWVVQNGEIIGFSE